MSYTNKQIDEFIGENLEACFGICKAWGLDIVSVNDLRQAGEYLLDQI